MNHFKKIDTIEGYSIEYIRTHNSKVKLGNVNISNSNNKYIIVGNRVYMNPHIIIFYKFRGANEEHTIFFKDEDEIDDYVVENPHIFGKVFSTNKII